MEILKSIYYRFKYGKKLGYIFMLHRCEYKNDKNLECNEDMKVSPKYLEDFILRFKDQYDFISLEDLPERLHQKSGNKFMCITFDDGYKDNYTNAYPILKKYNIPFTIFVSTDFPDNHAILWWYKLEEILLNCNEISLLDGSTYKCSSKDEKEKTFMEIREKILNLNQENLENELIKLFGDKYDWKSNIKDLSMTWNEVISIEKDPLVTIGGHTKHHYNLKELESSEKVKEEVLSGLEILNKNLSKNISVFAYPFGSKFEVSEREIETLSNLDFKLACVAYGGYCGTKNTRNLYSLPRIMLREELNLKTFR